MARTVTHTVTQEQAGRTVKSIALGEMRLSHSLFSSLKFSGGIRVDGSPARANQRLTAGQTLEARLQDRGETLVPWDVPLRIVYADNDYWVIDKPAPLPTLCSAHQSGPTLENGLYAFLHCPEDYLFRPVNRLDKGTSGLMAVARNAHAQQLLQRQLHTDAFIREYLAVCRGKPPASAGIIDLPIAQGQTGVKRVISPSGKRAVTHYQLEKTGSGLCLLRLRLETGRTHQIRVHLQALGCPILGDYVYGEADPHLPGHFALHACALRFYQPITGEWVQAESPLPQALAALL